MARADDKFLLRLPPGLRDVIKASAKRSGRSMNAEILHVLAMAAPDTPLVQRLKAELIPSPTNAEGDSYNDAIHDAIRIVKEHG